MIDLDDTQSVLSSQGGDSVARSVDQFLHQCDQAHRESKSIALPSAYRHIDNIVVCGMGGSRLPALVFLHLYRENLRLPLDIVNNYDVPGYVNEKTLVILASYSGTTEEVLHAGKEAQKKGAKILGYCVQGGSLGSWLRDGGYPVYEFVPTYNPSAQPRIGVGYGFGALLGIFESLGLIRGAEPTDFLAMSELTTSFALDVKTEVNPAKQMAKVIYGKYPSYIVAEHLIGVGNVIQNQTNETTKSMAVYREIPELNHHLMEGLQFPAEHKATSLFVFFVSDLYSKQIQKRFTITADVVKQNGIATYAYELKGRTHLAQVMEAISLGNYMTMYLSALYGVDPTKIPYVDYFKAELKKMV